MKIKKGVRYEIGNENICRIGQGDRCGSGGCEWKKVFGYFCHEKREEEPSPYRLSGEPPVAKPPRKPKVKKPKAVPKVVVVSAVRETYTTVYGCSGRLTYDQDGKPVGVRAIVYARDGHRCLKCGETKNLTLDEVVPKSKGGKRSVENCQTLCGKCNGDKGNRTIDYRKNENKK